MFYYLFDYLEEVFSPPGFGVFQYLTVRSSLAAITALILAFYLGPKIIKQLQKKQIGETIKALGLGKVGSKVIQDTSPCILGMVNLVSYLIKVNAVK